jgi:hypothetical protein
MVKHSVGSHLKISSNLKRPFSSATGEPNEKEDGVGGESARRAGGEESLKLDGVLSARPFAFV